MTNLTAYQHRIMKWIVECFEERGFYPHVGGHLRRPTADILVGEGLIKLDARGWRVIGVTREGMAALERPPAPAITAVPGLPQTEEGLRSRLEQLDELGVRELRRLADKFNIPDRSRMRRAELVEAFSGVLLLFANGWSFDTTHTFQQWGRGNYQGLTLREALRMQDAGESSHQLTGEYSFKG